MQANRTERAQYRYLSLARSLGVSADQIRRFHSSGYVAQKKQLEFHAAARECDTPGGPTQVGFGGARGPGKSHALFAQVALDDCQRFDGLKVLYLRKVAKNAREQFDDLRRVVLRHVTHTPKKYEGLVIFPNGSRIFIGHFKNESDIDSYLGLEYDIIAIEEATTLTASKYKTLRDSNRTSKEGFRPRIYCSTNPGGTGHAWFKERFIKPARAHNETDTRFVFATVDDNVFIDEDYTKKLEENTGWKLKAYRYGDWDVAAGQFFTTFRLDLHSAPPDKIFNPYPENARFWCSLDYGWTHYTTCYLLMSYDGKIYILDEHADRKQAVAVHAAAIKEMIGRHGLRMDQLTSFVAGHDCFSQRGANNGETIADAYARNDIFLERANVDRISRAGRFLELMGDFERNIEPKLIISERCPKLLETLPILEHDPKRPEDVLKIDADEDGLGGDDAYDGAGYGIMVIASGWEHN